jgi:hypothetical protein
LLASCYLLTGIGFAFGQDDLAPLPKLDVPAKLESYADVPIVVANARRAITLLGTAQSKLDPNPEPAKCDTEDVRSFSSGYLLAHSGFNLFLGIQELGFPRIEGPNGLPNVGRRHFVQFGRSALLTAWTPNQLRDLLNVRQAMRDLPAPIRRDLSAFLSKLREYREHYARLKRARSALLDELFDREADAYYWYYAYWELSEKQRKEPEPAEAKEKPKGIGYDELSTLLDKHLRDVSDVAKNDPARCFVETKGPTITFPSEKLKYEYTTIYPTKYLVSFWRRRDMEGTSNLADYVITGVLETLRGE